MKNRYRKLLIGICSCRPERWEHSFAQIQKQIPPPQAQCHFIWVENGVHFPQVKKLVEKAKKRSVFPLHYAHLSAKNLPQSRNCALTHALAWGMDAIGFF